MNSGFVGEMSRWYFCVVVAMAAQMLLLLLWSFLSPLNTNGLNRILEPVYVPTAHCIGMLFFEEQMSLGNIPLGLALLFLTAMLYSVVIGTVFYAGNKLCDKYLPRKNKRKQDL